eukprot:GHVS01016494.1.p1 GENE.GHVS01016494.1~~GHVS01016494.1.p1  ORF type:complete len:131 (+),score=15.87 GHVS01016494.1:47-439(+)
MKSFMTILLFFVVVVSAADEVLRRCNKQSFGCLHGSKCVTSVSHGIESGVCVENQYADIVQQEVAELLGLIMDNHNISDFATYSNAFGINIILLPLKNFIDERIQKYKRRHTILFAPPDAVEETEADSGI